jgi:hypothetical protein
MVIRALDHVARCYTAADGAVINSLLSSQLDKGRLVKLSFDGVSDVPSSFVNTAIVALLGRYDEEFIKSHLTLIDATRQIGDMVRRCVANGVRRQQDESETGA